MYILYKDIVKIIIVIVYTTTSTKLRDKDAIQFSSSPESPGSCPCLHTGSNFFSSVLIINVYGFRFQDNAQFCMKSRGHFFVLAAF